MLPVIRELAAAGVPMSIDTTRAAVAAAALEAGAAVVNDVSGGLADPDMAKVVADAGCPWVLMHWRGHSRRMQRAGHVQRRGRRGPGRAGRSGSTTALAAGVGRRPDHHRPGPRLRQDGRAQLAAQRRGCDELLALGYPVLFGASRKSYLGPRCWPDPDGTPRPVGEREAATVATSVLAVAAGAWGVRVHDVRATVDALAVWRATGGTPGYRRPRVTRSR